MASDGYNPQDLNELRQLLDQRGRPLSGELVPYEADYYSDMMSDVSEVVIGPTVTIGQVLTTSRSSLRFDTGERTRVSHNVSMLGNMALAMPLHPILGKYVGKACLSIERYIGDTQTDYVQLTTSMHETGGVSLNCAESSISNPTHPAVKNMIGVVRLSQVGDFADSMSDGGYSIVEDRVFDPADSSRVIKYLVTRLKHL